MTQIYRMFVMTMTLKLNVSFSDLAFESFSQ